MKTWKKILAPITAGALAVGSAFAEYNATYTAEDAPKILMDGLGFFGIAVISIIGIVALVVTVRLFTGKSIKPKWR